jgi:hypothetical protein
MPPKVEEGLCQLIAYKYLQFVSTQSLHFLSSSSLRDTPASAAGTSHSLGEHSEAAEDQLQREYFLHQIEHDPSVVYGDGFREALRVDQALGLTVLLECLEQNNAVEFPKV